MKQPLTLFGDRLRVARAKADLSQKQLGIKIGLDVSVASARMNQYEVGSHSPKYDTAKRIAEVLDVPTSYFYEADPSTSEMLLAFGTLSETDRAKVMDLIRKISLVD